MQTTTQHELTIITTILFLLCNYCNATFVEMQQNKSFWDIVKRHPASYSRNVHMHSRHGHYISINEAGEVKAVFDSKSPDIVLEMSSFGKLHKRLRRPNSHFLAINKHGMITTKKNMTADTLFREHHGGSWLWYQNDETDFILAFGKKGQPRHNVTDRVHVTRTQFLVIPLCGRVRCAD